MHFSPLRINMQSIYLKSRLSVYIPFEFTLTATNIKVLCVLSEVIINASKMKLLSVFVCRLQHVELRVRSKNWPSSSVNRTQIASKHLSIQSMHGL